MIMSIHLTKSHYENAILQLFTQTLGYSYAYGPNIKFDYHLLIQ